MSESTSSRVANVTIALLGAAVLGLQFARAIGWWLDHHSNPRPWTTAK